MTVEGSPRRRQKKKISRVSARLRPDQGFGMFELPSRRGAQRRCAGYRRGVQRGRGRDQRASRDVDRVGPRRQADGALPRCASTRTSGSTRRSRPPRPTRATLATGVPTRPPCRPPRSRSCAARPKIECNRCKTAEPADGRTYRVDTYIVLYDYDDGDPAERTPGEAGEGRRRARRGRRRCWRERPPTFDEATAEASSAARMATFAYNAINAAGRFSRRSACPERACRPRAAAHPRPARRPLDELRASGEDSARTAFKKIKPKSLQIFSRQFATMIEAGLNVVCALVILEKQTDD